MLISNWKVLKMGGGFIFNIQNLIVYGARINKGKTMTGKKMKINFIKFPRTDNRWIMSQQITLYIYE